MTTPEDKSFTMTNPDEKFSTMAKSVGVDLCQPPPENKSTILTKPEGVDWSVADELKRGEKVDMSILQKGDIGLEPDVTLKVDEWGLFLAWKSEKKDWVVQDLNMIRDIGHGKKLMEENMLNIFKKKHGEDFEKKSVNISIGSEMVTKDNYNIVFSDVDTAAVWKKGLSELVNNPKINNFSPMANLKKQWMKLRMMVSADGKILAKNICRCFQMTKEVGEIVNKELGEAGAISTGAIDLELFTFEIFYKIYKAVCPRNDIDELISSIHKPKDCDQDIKCQEFVEFLNKKQRDPRLNEILYAEYNEKRAMDTIVKYENIPSPPVDPWKFFISRDLFSRYLLSEENSPVFLDRLKLHQDMDQPLSHYYINSSHNTYLTGRQFKGKSSVKMYRQVLLSGCRCIELDCWDGDNQEPKITHGLCYCTDIPFKDVIEAIRDCAFVTSDYPLILSFENHCSRNQQLKMAMYCDEILGDLLLKEPLADVPLLPGYPLPSPNQLRRKILIKNKRLDPEVERVELELFLSGVTSPEENEDQKEESPTASHQELSIAGSLDDSLENGGIALPIATTHQVTSSEKIHPYLSSMVNYTCPIKFLGFAHAKKQKSSFKMSTFGETQALGYLNRQEPSEMVNYNKRQLSRIYPKGKRVDSSNYMPQLFWNAGCQMVSLNFQTPDIPMQLNQGKFEYNGNCGYILKPDIMRREDQLGVFDPFSMTSMDGVIAAHCKIKVISGQFLSDKNVGTYVKLDMYGLPVDTFKKEFKTKVVPANGINPVYDEAAFEFRKVVMPELAVLRFGAYDENGKLLGQRILPFDDLQHGYRHITLRTENNQPIPLAMLFCHIELDVYITDEHEEMITLMMDPIASLSKEEARKQELRKEGYSESEIGDIFKASAKEIKEIKNPEVKFVEVKKDIISKTKSITEIVEDLKQEKGYKKVIKKQVKEMELLKSKHQKEQSILKGKSTKDLLTTSFMPLVGDITTNNSSKEQKNKLTEILERQDREEKDMEKHHAEGQEAVLITLMQASQEKQGKELEVHLEKMHKELCSAQAKHSLETLNSIKSDKTFNKKSQKTRRIKEISENNIKKFGQERETQRDEHDKERVRLKKHHIRQMEDLNKYLLILLRLDGSENEMNGQNGNKGTIA